MMNRPQLGRWRGRTSRAEDQIDEAIGTLESALEVNPMAPPSATEGKQDECEALAAECVSEAIGCLHGAKSRLAASADHLDWERTKAIREFPGKVHKFIEEHGAELPAELIALSDACKGKARP